MIDVGLSATEQRAFRNQLRMSYRARTIIDVLDADEKNAVTIHGRVVAGAVQVDTSQAVDRSLELQLADVDRAFQFVPGSPAHFAMYVDNFLRVRRGVFVDELNDWVDVPVFTGPITSVSPQGSVVNVTAMGKEALALAPALAWRPVTVPKGTLISEAIRDLMRPKGERRFDLPATKMRTRTPIALGRQSEPWKAASKLAVSVDRQLFYDGRGKLRLRAWPSHPLWTFATGEGGTVLTRPTRTYSHDDLRNVVLALGPKPEGKKDRLRFVAMPPRGHALSPFSLARNGDPRFLVEVLEMEHASRTEQVRNAARRTLDDVLRAETSVTFDAAPCLQLEPGDLVALDENGERTTFRLRQFTIPLTGDVMAVGYTRPISRHKRKKKR